LRRILDCPIKAKAGLRKTGYNKFFDEWSEGTGLLLQEEEQSTGRRVSDERHQELLQRAHRQVFARWIRDERFSDLSRT
jgi:hypothetical protein